MIGTTALLAFAVAGLLELRTGMQVAPVPGPIPAAGRSDDAAPPVVADAIILQEAIDPSAALDRPIFAPARRPSAPPPPEIDLTPAVEFAPMPADEPEFLPIPAPPPPVDRLAGLRLLGVMTGAGPARALVFLPDSGAEWVRIDAEIRGWRVAGIWSDRIEVRRGSRRRVAELGDEGSEVPNE